MRERFDKIPTLYVADGETEISEKQIEEVLAPYKKELLGLDDEVRKSILKAKRPDYSPEEIDEADEKLVEAANSQIEKDNRSDEIRDLLFGYYYIHFLNRYSIA